MAVAVLVLLAIVVFTVIGWWAAKSWQPRAPIPTASAALIASRHRAEQHRRATSALIRIAYRNLQIALLQLEQAPDFRRAAGYAKQASQVPLLYCHQQFQRFRPQILAVLSHKLRGNVPLAEATAGLHELIVAPGVAPFEAEYLVSEAQRSAPVPAYSDQIRQSQAEHQRRTAALRSLRDLDPEIREQLMELEQERFRDELLGNQNDAKDGVTELD